MSVESCQLRNGPNDPQSDHRHMLEEPAWNSVEVLLTKQLLRCAETYWPQILAARLVGDLELEKRRLAHYEKSIRDAIGYYTSCNSEWKQLVESKVNT